MLKSSYLGKFKDNPRYGLNEFDLKTLVEDDNYIISSNRPLRESEIMKIPSEKVEKFVDSVLTDKSLNNLMYSSTARSEIKLVKKVSQKVNSNKNKKIFDKSEVSPQDIVFKRIKNEAIGKIILETKGYKDKKIENHQDMKKKIYSFFESIREENRKIELSYKEETELYRRRRFNEIFENIKSKIKDHGLALPDITIDTKNVFSRLYNNVVFFYNSSEEINNGIKKSSSCINSKTKNNVMNVKSVLSNSSGKEFTLKITDKEFMKCYTKHSGGPNVRHQHKDIEDKNKNDYVHLIDIRDDEGNSFLHQSVVERLYNLAFYLLMKGIDANVQNNEGETPLHLAVRNADKKIIQLLLDSGAEVDRVNKKNENVVEIAQYDLKKHFGFEGLLVEAEKAKKLRNNFNK